MPGGGLTGDVEPRNAACGAVIWCSCGFILHVCQLHTYCRRVPAEDCATIPRLGSLEHSVYQRGMRNPVPFFPWKMGKEQDLREEATAML